MKTKKNHPERTQLAQRQARAVQPAALERVALQCVIAHLQVARQQAEFAGAPRLVIAIRRALKSADGARRHKDGLLARAEDHDRNR